MIEEKGNIMLIIILIKIIFFGGYLFLIHSSFHHHFLFKKFLENLNIFIMILGEKYIVILYVFIVDFCDDFIS